MAIYGRSVTQSVYEMKQASSDLSRAIVVDGLDIDEVKEIVHDTARTMEDVSEFAKFFGSIVVQWGSTSDVPLNNVRAAAAHAKTATEQLSQVRHELALAADAMSETKRFDEHGTLITDYQADS